MKTWQLKHPAEFTNSTLIPLPHEPNGCWGEKGARPWRMGIRGFYRACHALDVVRAGDQDRWALAWRFEPGPDAGMGECWSVIFDHLKKNWANELSPLLLWDRKVWGHQGADSLPQVVRQESENLLATSMYSLRGTEATKCYLGSSSWSQRSRQKNTIHWNIPNAQREKNKHSRRSSSCSCKSWWTMWTRIKQEQARRFIIARNDLGN